MRIISKFHDYYDCCQDPSDKVNLYVRHTKTYEGYTGGGFHSGCNLFDPIIRFNLIGFCGKIYPCCEINVAEPMKQKNSSAAPKRSSTFIYDIDKLIEFYEPFELMKRMGKNKFRYRPYGYIEDVINFWKRVNGGETLRAINRAKKAFVELHTPCFVIYKKEEHCSNKENQLLDADCCLEDYRFAKVFSPHLAAQEIEMYLFGVLGSGQREKIPPVSNNDLIEAKGFDLKTSFRKAKQK